MELSIGIVFLLGFCIYAFFRGVYVLAVIDFDIVADGKVGDLNDTQREYLHDVVSSGKHLMVIINDILDLAKVEAGKIELRYSTVDLVGFLNDSLGIIRDQADRKGVALATEFADLPSQVNIDARLMRQVIYNLLQNAVKFTDRAGRVTLSAEIEEAAATTLLTITVCDTGIGIDSANLERIFEDFEQISSFIDSSTKGTGLGLALRKQFVELHGGIITAESEGLGRGSIFSFSVPIGGPD